MAVSRVFGTIDGVEMTLDHADGDRWQVPVPMDEDGEYVIEIIAEDEAGNQSYLAKMLFTVNTSLLCAHLISLPYYGILQKNIYVACDAGSNYRSEIIEPACSNGGTDMQKMRLYAGEERHVRILIRAAKEEAFLIREARYELKLYGNIVQAGECVINDHILDVILRPERKSIYSLEFIYKIADETLIEKINVEVM